MRLLTAATLLVCTVFAQGDSPTVNNPDGKDKYNADAKQKLKAKVAAPVVDHVKSFDIRMLARLASALTQMDYMRDTWYEKNKKGFYKNRPIAHVDQKYPNAQQVEFVQTKHKELVDSDTIVREQLKPDEDRVLKVSAEPGTVKPSLPPTATTGTQENTTTRPMGTQPSNKTTASQVPTTTTEASTSTTGASTSTTGASASTTGASTSTTGASTSSTGASTPTTGASTPTTRASTPTTGASRSTTQKSTTVGVPNE